MAIKYFYIFVKINSPVKLSSAELSMYLNTHLKFLFFCHSEIKSLKKALDYEGFKKEPFETKHKARNYFNQNDYLLDKYISSAKNRLPENEIMILLGFKKRITSDFLILKSLKSYTIFIDMENNIYGVHSLSDPLDEMLLLPVVVNMTILPFRDKIIYDGFINSYNMHIGPNMKRSYQDLLNENRKSKKIITRIN